MAIRPVSQQTLAAISGESASEAMGRFGQSIADMGQAFEEQKQNAQMREFRTKQMASMDLEKQKTQIDIDLASQQKDEWLKNKGLRTLKSEQEVATLKEQAKERRAGNVLTATSNKDSLAYLKAMQTKGDISPETYDSLSAMSMKERKDFMAKNQFWYDKDFQQQMWLQKEAAKAKPTTGAKRPPIEGTGVSTETIGAKIEAADSAAGMTQDYADAINEDGKRILATGARGMVDQYKDLGYSQDQIENMMVEVYKGMYDTADEAMPVWKIGQEPTVSPQDVVSQVRNVLDQQYSKMLGTTKGAESIADTALPKGLTETMVTAIMKDMNMTRQEVVDAYEPE